MEVLGVTVTKGHMIIGTSILILAVVSYLLVLLQEATTRKLRSIDKKQAISDLSDGASKALDAINAETERYAPVAKRYTSAVRTSVTQQFSFAGRIGRGDFIKSILAAVGFLFILMSVSMWLTEFRGQAPNALGMLVFVVALILYVWLSSAACAKRTRDTGVTVWWALALLVPPVNLAATIFLLFVPTDEFVGRGL